MSTVFSADNRSVSYQAGRITVILLTLFFCILTNVLNAQSAASPTYSPAPQFERATPFTNGFARVLQGRKSYYIDTTGQFAFDEFAPLESRGNLSEDFQVTHTLSSVSHPERWGVLKKDRWVLPPVYDSIDTRFNTWKLLKEGKRTWCDTNGRLLLPFRFSDAGYLDGRFFDVRQNGKWGVYDARQDSVVIPFLYEEFDYCGGCGLRSDYVLAKKNGKWGIIGFDNAQRVPFEYDHEHWSMRSDEWVTSLRRNGERVLINMRTGKVFGHPQYSLPESVLWNDLACLGKPAGKKQQFGLVTPEGKPVTKFEYDYITWFDEDNDRLAGYACVEKDKKYGVIDTAGRVIIPIRYDALIWAYDDSTFYVNGEDRQWLLDQHGNPLLPGPYKRIDGLNAYGSQPTLYELSKDDKYALYDRRTQVTTPFVYDNLSTSSLAGFIISERAQKKGLINLAGKEIFPPQFDAIDWFYSSPDILQLRKDEYAGLYDTSGRVILPAVYDFIFQDFEDTGYLRLKTHVNDERQEGLATTRGQVLLRPAYTSIVEIEGSSWLLQKDSSYYLFDSRTGKIDSLPSREVSIAGEKKLLFLRDPSTSLYKLYDPISGHTIAEGYDVIFPFRNHMALAKKGDKFGMIDVKGKAVIPFGYTQLSEFQQGVTYASKDDQKYGFIDSTGREIIPFEYDLPYRYSGDDEYSLFGDLLLYKYDFTAGELLKGLARRDGKIIVSPAYDIIWKDTSGKGYLVRQNGKFGVLSPEGQVLLPAVYQDMMPEEANRFSGAIRLSFPLLCSTGGSWQYLTTTGHPLPVRVGEALHFWDDYPQAEVPVSKPSIKKAATKPSMRKATSKPPLLRAAAKSPVEKKQ